MFPCMLRYGNKKPAERAVKNNPMKLYFEEGFPPKPPPKLPRRRSFKWQIIQMILASVFWAFFVYVVSQTNIIFAGVLAGFGILALRQWGKNMDTLVMEDLAESLGLDEST